MCLKLVMLHKFVFSLVLGIVVFRGDSAQSLELAIVVVVVLVVEKGKAATKSLEATANSE